MLINEQEAMIQDYWGERMDSSSDGGSVASHGIAQRLRDALRVLDLHQWSRGDGHRAIAFLWLAGGSVLADPNASS